MTDKPFHHGNLRAVLLERAEAMLREDGLDGLSLRELARQAGVSHGAPRSHFVDRQALLDALIERGFTRLTHDVRRALSGHRSQRARLGRVAQAYVDFAIDDAALMELMFLAKTTGLPPAGRDAASGLFQVLDEAMGPLDQTNQDPSSRASFTLLFGATMQGIAALVSSHRITRQQGDSLVDEAMDMLLESRLGARAIRQ